MALFCISCKQREFVLQVGRLGQWEAGEVLLVLETYYEVILEFFCLRATADLGGIYDEAHS